MGNIKKAKTKFVNEISKHYMAINILMLGLAIYIIIFPMISIPIKKVIPAFGICPYLQMTGKPCPLCGGTRYFANIFEILHDIKYLWSPFGIIAIIILLEIIFRIKNIIAIKKKKDMQNTVEIDIIITSIIMIAFFMYEFLYFFIQSH